MSQELAKIHPVQQQNSKSCDNNRPSLIYVNERMENEIVKQHKTEKFRHRNVEKY